MHAQRDRQRLAVAIVASLVLHGLVAGLIPSLTHVYASQPTLITISFLRIEHPKAHRSHQVVAHTTPHRTLHPAQRQTRHPAPRPTPGVHRAALALIVPHAPIHRVTGKPHVQPVASPQPPVAQKVVPSITPRMATSTTTSTTPVAVVQATPKPGVHGALPFGMDQAIPVLDPHVRNDLLALNVHVTLTIAVGDDGKTKHVTFSPPLDSTVESKITSMLATASWDPSYCGGGIPCDGIATITL